MAINHHFICRYAKHLETLIKKAIIFVSFHRVCVCVCVCSCVYMANTVEFTRIEEENDTKTKATR
jgi:hypothetical protein